MSITIPRQLVNQLLQHAQQATDKEVCGLISSRDGVPFHCYKVANIADHPDTRFRMDPKQQIDAMRQMRDAGETLFAIYHSHPSSPALPSVTDLKEASYPETLYLIISLNTKGVLEMRGYRIIDGKVEEVALEI